MKEAEGEAEVLGAEVEEKVGGGEEGGEEEDIRVAVVGGRDAEAEKVREEMWEGRGKQQ